MRLENSVGRAPAGWRGVAIYLAIAFGLSWVAQLLTAPAMQAARTGAAGSGPSILFVAAAVMAPPAIGAFVVRQWVEGGYFADAGLRWPSWRYLLIAWLGPLVLTVLSLVISLAVYPFEMPQPPSGSVEAFIALQLAQALTLAVLLNSLFAFGEEFGWRGYLLPRLVRLMGFWPGLLAHGALWGFWHAPWILLIGFNFPGHPVLGIPLFTIAGMLMGVLFGWLQLASGSVVAPTVAHGALNAVGALPMLLLRGVDPAVAGPIYSPLGWLVMLLAIGLLIATGQLPGFALQEERTGDTI